MQLPSEVENILDRLQHAGFKAYAVGGCVRDLILGRIPGDWDIATSAKPADIQKIFPKSFYANRFGTVTVLISPLDKGGPGGLPAGQAGISEIEVTTYRVDASYSDRRHPDSVAFTSTLEEDLARRDFTVNAMAIGELEGVKKVAIANNLRLIDPFNGQIDLKNRLIRAVGNATERFQEDALRLFRAVRLATQLNFEIETDTGKALTQNAHLVTAVSSERIRDELIKIIMSDRPEKGFILLTQTGLLKHILPELQEGVGVSQNKHHIYTVLEHNIKSLQFAADYNYPFHIRLAALLHDIGKPRTKRPKGNDYTFYGHEIVGARMAEELLRRLHFPNPEIKKVVHLVRHHMFYYDIGKVTEAGMRRLLRRVGKENFDDLIKLRIAERKGSGVPKARPYRLRHLQFMAEKASQQPLTVGQLAIRGNELMEQLNLSPGPQIGGILSALLAEVLADPDRNTQEWLLKKAKELMNLDPTALKARGQTAIETEEHKREDEIKRKYHVG